MANTIQAKKRVRQNEHRRQNNASQRSLVRTYIKKVVNAVKTGNRAEAEAAYNIAIPFIDRSAGKGIIHKNKAARHKSRLLSHIRAMATA